MKQFRVVNGFLYFFHENDTDTHGKAGLKREPKRQDII